MIAGTTCANCGKVSGSEASGVVPGSAPSEVPDELVEPVRSGKRRALLWGLGLGLAGVALVGLVAVLLMPKAEVIKLYRPHTTSTVPSSTVVTVVPVEPVGRLSAAEAQAVSSWWSGAAPKYANLVSALAATSQAGGAGQSCAALVTATQAFESQSPVPSGTLSPAYVKVLTELSAASAACGSGAGDTAVVAGSAQSALSAFVDQAKSVLGHPLAGT